MIFVTYEEGYYIAFRAFDVRTKDITHLVISRRSRYRSTYDVYFNTTIHTELEILSTSSAESVLGTRRALLLHACAPGEGDYTHRWHFEASVPLIQTAYKVDTSVA